MNFESDEECAADYGVFGDRACKCSGCNPKPRTMTGADREAINRANRERERDRQTSSSFNRAMIDLYNARRP